MLLHWRQNAQIALYPAVVVVSDVILNHGNKLLAAGEASAVVPLTLEDAPEAFHRPVVNALAHSGHISMIGENAYRLCSAPPGLSFRKAPHLRGDSLALRDNSPSGNLQHHSGITDAPIHMEYPGFSVCTVVLQCWRLPWPSALQ